MRSFYDILEISPLAPVDEVKKAYFNYLRKVHPDKRSDDANAESVSQATLIWATLKNIAKRREYDLWLREQYYRETKGTVVESIEVFPDETHIEEVCRCGDKYIVPPQEFYSAFVGSRSAISRRRSAKSLN